MSDTRLTYARLDALRRAAEASPGAAAPRRELGAALFYAGEQEAGLAALREAVAADPADAASLALLGHALASLRRPEEAERHYRAALANGGEDAAQRFNIGCAWLAAGEAVRAEAGFRAALAVRADYPAALNNLGTALRQQGRPAEALECYRRAHAIQADLPGLDGNLGSALLALGRAEDALGHLRAAVRADPNSAEAANMLGGGLLALDLAEEAAGWFRLAVKREPQHLQARFGLAVALLAEGRFREGWEAYEVRWQDPAFIADERVFEQPAWHGEVPLEGRTILLHAEQGLGDTLQFVRYAALARARGARVAVAVQAPLMALCAGLADAVLERGAEPPPFDLHCPLLSLPRAFGTRLDSIPAEIPYLHAPPDRVGAWAARLGEATRPRIGIAVAGDPAHPEDAQRSIPAAVFLRAFDGIDAELHVLQKPIRDSDAPALAGVHMHAAGMEDFRDVAALASLMDLVVTVDTAAAHLAGALGLPVWVLLQRGADFRWLRNRTDSPWYPTARLFRQPRYGDWPTVIAKVNAALRQRW